MEKCSFRDSDMELPIIEGVIGSRYGGPGQKYGEYKPTYQYGHCRALKTPVAGNPHRLIHIRYMAPATTGHRLLIIRIIPSVGSHCLR